MIRLALFLLGGGILQAAAEPAFNWPRQETVPAEFPVLNGHTNTVPDIVGPINGPVDLVIFTEGNHFPVLLPLVYEEFPKWLRQQPDSDPAAAPPIITVVTLPQVLIVEALRSGGIALGSAVVRIDPQDGLFPDVVMGGVAPLTKLHVAGIVEARARRFARHRGLAILVAKGNPRRIRLLEDLGREDVRWIMATPKEAGARRQYLNAFAKLLPKATAPEALLQRERRDFQGRLGIQHRDVPFAIGSKLADAGVIFNHLARYYAEQFPDRFEVVEVEGAEKFPADIYATLTEKGSDDALAAQFMEFLFEIAPRAYPKGGFAVLEEAKLGESVPLSPAK
ncbi:MAG: substrate-binding domain-containing protein [Verrucomicrobiota bacterium]